MKPFAAYSRRYERKRRLLIAAGMRAFDLKKQGAFTQTRSKPSDILLFATLRNEAPADSHTFLSTTARRSASIIL